MKKPPARRLVALFTCLILGLVGILFRLAVLQVRDASAYDQLALRQRLHTVELPAQRGAILDRDRHPLALSVEARDVVADPTLVRDVPGTAALLAQALQLKARKVEAALRHPTSPRFVEIAERVDMSVAARVEKMELPGIVLSDTTKRVYPNGALAPQVLGFVNVDGEGGNGLERQYQDILAGRAGRRVLERDPHGHAIPSGVSRDTDPIPGADVVTTIDTQLQYRAQLALRDAVWGTRAKGGSLIMLDAHTGNVLAMATYPWFDPNRYADYGNHQEVYQNLPITAVYEPGSVNKVITAAAAIQEHVVDLSQPMEVPDTLQVADHLFHDAHEHPPTAMTLADIISQSSNIGTIRIAEILGKERLFDYLTRFGLGRRTGIGFPGEVDGIMPGPDEWSGTSIGTIPVGQGVAVTPLQMASVYEAIANDGVWVQPRLVKGFVQPDGTYTQANPPHRHRVISESTDRTLRQILAYAVESGTGQLAQIPGYWVAGKTGTALIPDPDGGYYSGRYVASFIGFLPASDPQIVIAAILDQPVTEYGGIASAPLFQKVARYAIARLRIPPADRPPLPPHAIPYSR